MVWLCSTLPGVGETRARALVARFGVEELWNVIENEPARLAAVSGITAAMAERIAESVT